MPEAAQADKKRSGWRWKLILFMILLSIMAASVKDCAVYLATYNAKPQPQPISQPPLAPKVQVHSAAEIDKLLAKMRHNPELTHCQADQYVLENWANYAYQRYQELDSRYQELDSQNQALQRIYDENLVAAAVFGIGIGAGITLVILFAKFLRRLRPFSPERKQLFALTIGALWVCVATLYILGLARSPEESSDTNLTLAHPINIAVSVFLFSLPAILFAGIGFWWFGRDKIKEKT